MCRSIFAESISRKCSIYNVKAMSAGSHPGDDIHPVAHRILKDNHYSAINLVSKSWDSVAAWQPDIVITLSDKVLKEKCPAYVGQSVHVHWSISDPTSHLGNMEDNFTKVFLILEKRITKILETDMGNMNKTEIRAHLKKGLE